MAKPAQSAPAITRARHAQNTAHAKATKPARAIKAALSSSLLLLGLAFPSVAFAAQNITNLGWGQNKTDGDTYYVLGGDLSLGFFTGSKTSTYNFNNSPLYFGNSSKTPSTNTFSFNAWGVYTYSGTFNAKEIYFTGNLNFGSGTSINFVSKGAIEADDWRVNSGYDGTYSAGISLKGDSISLKNSSITTNKNSSANTGRKYIHLRADNGITLTNTNITQTNGGAIDYDSQDVDEDNAEVLINAGNGKLDANKLTMNIGGGNYANQVVIKAGNMDFKSANITLRGGSYAGQTTKFQLISQNGISFDGASKLDLESDWVRMETTNGDITNNATINIAGGGATVDGKVNFIATNGNITLNSVTATLSQGKSEFNVKAGGDINISNLVYRANLGTAVNAGYANFEGKNITINDGSIESNRGIDNSTDTAGELNTTFRAQENITLNNFNIRLVAGLAGIGSPDSLTFIGKNLTHTGRIYVADGWQHTWEGVTFDFSGITESASVGDMSVVAAIIKTNKNFKANSLVVQARQTNGGFGGAGSLIYTAENANLTFENLTLNDNGGTGYTSRLTFYDANGSGSFVKGSTLNATNLTLGTMAGLYANNIETANIQNLILKSESAANFNQLNIINGGSIVMDVKSAINIKQSFSVDVKQSSNAVDNFGAPILYVVNGASLETANIQANKTYRFITASGGISYNFTTASGATSTFYCDGSASTLEKCTYIKNSIAIYKKDKVEPSKDANGNLDYTEGQSYLTEFGNKLGLRFEKVVDYSTIGIKALADNPDNPYDIGDIRYYIWQKGGTSKGDEYVSKIAGISTTSLRNEMIEQVQNGQEVLDSNGDAVMVETTNSDIFQWMQFLSIRSKGITWTGTNIMDYDIDFFYDTATQLYNTLGQVASTERKSSMASSTRLAADIAKIQRLVKLSRGVTDEGDTRFAQYLRSLKGKRFASNDAGSVAGGANGAASDYAESSALDPAFLYKFSNRHDYSNNIWATAIGSASFVTNGHGTLYGINTGYDRFIPVGESGVIVGAFGAYGYGSYTADLIKNHSHNINAGIYSRAFIGNNEIDLNIGYTIGMNNEDIYTRQNIWLSSLDQNYRYNTHTMNLSANYGYVFGVKNGSLVFKPAIGLGYYLMHVGEITGDSAPINVSNAGYGNASYTFETNETAIQSPKITQNMLTLNLTLETRQYFSQGSYWFVNVAGQKDLFISSGSVTEVRFIGNGALSYKQGDMLNTHLLGAVGGEVMLGKKTFINFALGGRAGLTYKDINITANLGARYVF